MPWAAVTSPPKPAPQSFQESSVRFEFSPERKGMDHDIFRQGAGGLHERRGLGRDSSVRPDKVDAGRLGLRDVGVHQSDPRSVAILGDVVNGGVVDLEHQIVNPSVLANLEDKNTEVSRVLLRFKVLCLPRYPVE